MDEYLTIYANRELYRLPNRDEVHLIECVLPDGWTYGASWLAKAEKVVVKGMTSQTAGTYFFTEPSHLEEIDP